MELVGEQPGGYLRSRLTRMLLLMAGSLLLSAVLGFLLWKASLPWVAVILPLAAVLYVRFTLVSFKRVWHGYRAEVLVAHAIPNVGGVVAHSLDLGGFDADHLVVWSKAVLIETKGVRGRISLGPDGALMANGRPLRSDPVTQTLRTVQDVFKLTGTRPFPVVCLAYADSVMLQTRGVWVVSPDRLSDAFNAAPSLPVPRLMSLVAFMRARAAG